MNIARTPDRKLLVSQNNIDIYYDNSDDWIYADWKGYQTVGFVQDGCEQILDCMVDMGTSKVLNDNTNVEGIWIGAADWVATDWFPRMRQAGLKHFAWVYSPARLSQVSTDETLKRALPHVANMFRNVDEAAEWLREQK